jgi:hypothetical protein
MLMRGDHLLIFCASAVAFLPTFAGCAAEKPQPPVAAPAQPATAQNAPPPALSEAEAAAKRKEEEARMNQVVTRVQEQTGRNFFTFLREFPVDGRKFEAPFFIVYEDCLPGPAPMIERQKELETRELDQARTLVIVNYDKERVGEYVEEGLGGLVDQAFGQPGLTAWRENVSIKALDLKNPWRNRKVSATYEPPTRIGKSAGKYEETGGWTASGFTLNTNQGSLIDQVLLTVVGKREQADFDPPGAIVPSLIFLRDERSDYRRSIGFDDVHVKGLWFLPDGQTLAAVDENMQLWYWAAVERKLLQQDGVQHSGLSPDGKLTARYRDGEIWVQPVVGGATTAAEVKDTLNTGPNYKLRFESQFQDQWGRPLFPPSLLISPDGNYLVAIGGSEWNIWSLSEPPGKPRYVQLPSRPGTDVRPQVTSLAFAPNGGPLIALLSSPAPKDGKQYLTFWDTETAALQKSIEIDPGTNHLSFAPEGDYFAAWSEGGSIGFWSLPEGEKRGTTKLEFPVQQNPWHAPGDRLTLLRDGGLAALCADGAIRIYDAGQNTPRMILQLTTPPQPATAMAIALREQRLYSGHADGNVYEWDLATGKRVEVPDELFAKDADLAKPPATPQPAPAAPTVTANRPAAGASAAPARAPATSVDPAFLYCLGTPKSSDPATAPAPSVDPANASAAKTEIAQPKPQPKRAREFEVRQWKDVSGKFSIEAKLSGLAGGIVKLKRPDGTVISVPLDRLSEADRAYLEELKR